MKWFGLFCFLALILLLLGGLFEAHAKDADKKPADTPAIKQLEASGNRLIVRSEKNGKKTAREFPMMFDIAKRAREKRVEKQKKGKVK